MDKAAITRREAFLDQMVSFGKELLAQSGQQGYDGLTFGNIFANAFSIGGKYKAAQLIGVGIAQIDFAIKEDPRLKLNTLVKLANLIGYDVEIKLVKK